MGRLYRLSGGVPRVINVLCDRALLGTYVQEKERVDRATLKQAAREVFPEARRHSLLMPLLMVLIAMLVGALAVTLYRSEQREIASTAALARPIVETITTPRDKDVAVNTAAPAAQLPATLDWPAAEPRARSEQLAYAALFRAWGADYLWADACRQAESLGLHCRSARAGLDELRQLNRPAVLVMRDDQAPFQAALIALDDKSATFVIGTETRSVAFGALATQWSGQYTLFWRLPAIARETIRAGERGPAVQWLIGQLAQAQGKNADPNQAPVFDEALARQVKQFQLAQGLIPDGIVGPQTVVRLAGVGDRSAPQLLPRQGSR